LDGAIPVKVGASHTVGTGSIQPYKWYTTTRKGGTVEIIEDPSLRQDILNILIEEYSLMEPRSGIHSSDLIYCLTRSYHSKVDYIPPTEAESLTFSIGLGLERVIIQHTATRVEPIEIEGVWLSPDFLLQNIHSELKTTRWGENHDLPSTWLQQVMNYCYATDHLVYNLVVLHIIPAKLRGWRLFFTQEEIEENWGYMLQRKEVLEQALNDQVPPREFTYNEDWECANCRYRLRCDTAYQARLSGVT
jgi:hypothetical protein